MSRWVARVGKKIKVYGGKFDKLRTFDQTFACVVWMSFIICYFSLVFYVKSKQITKIYLEDFCMNFAALLIMYSLLMNDET